MAAHIGKPTILLVLTATLVSAAEQPPSPSSPRDSGSEAKSYSTALGRVEVALRPDKPEVMIGEPVYLSFTVRNPDDSGTLTGPVLGPDSERWNRAGRVSHTWIQVALVVKERAAGLWTLLFVGPANHLFPAVS